MESHRTKIVLLLLLVCSFARADELAKLNDVSRPELLIKTGTPGLFIAAPAVKTDIALEIRGVVARGTIHQQFSNPTNHCVEALYAFPLPDNAAVDSLTITVNGRRIEGEVKEREEAQKTYEAAKSEGKSATLLEQQRPNLFTMSVASIAAGETVDVEIGYGQTLLYDDGHFSIRFPLAIGPRYDSATSGAAPLPAMQHELASKTRNPVTITADVDAGIPLRDITSATHAIDATQTGTTRWSVKLKDHEIASDRDFDLTWTPQLGTQPKAAVFTETVGGQRYSLMMLFPQDLAAAPSVVLPREAIFIIDTSGSMAGPSIEQAKRALLMAVERLRPNDTFNIIEFNSTASRLFDAPQPARSDLVARAREWIDKLDADGGTEMMPALQMALENVQPAIAVRQVIFMTDGQVSNESALLAYIRAHAGESRLFTVAIGAAPNAAFLRSGARSGRGTFTAITNLNELEAKMNVLFRKLESPTLSGVDVQISDASAEVWPPRAGDLYAGEPLVIAARYASPSAKIHVLGRSTLSTWTQDVEPSGESSSHAGIAKLWARQKVESLLDANSETPSDDVRKSIVALGIEHHLVTPFTSLVAVDTTPNGVNAAVCTPELVPLNLPAGWGGLDADGSLPSTATPAMLWIVFGVVLFLGAAVVAVRQ